MSKLDPQCKAVLDAAAQQRTAFDADTPEEARALYAATTRRYRPEVPPMAGMDDIEADGPHGPVPMRLYRPTTAPTPAAAMVFLHGGGWVVGDLYTHEHVAQAFAHEAGAVVVSVDYRLGPERRFPAAVDDTMAALRHVAARGDALGVDADRMGVGGDSAGGNLAAAAALVARDDGGPALAFQWLLYPATDMTADNASRRDFGEGYLLSAKAIAWFEAQYLADPGQRTDFRASPQLAASHEGLPPALVQTGGFDPLRDEGRAYAETLKTAGVPVEYVCYDGMIHGFARMGAIVDKANEAIADAARAFAAAVK